MTMRLCSGCQSKMPEDQPGKCDACRGDRQHSVNGSDGPLRQQATGYTAVLDKLRKGTRWQRVRDIIAKRDPICTRCNAALTEIIDHIVPAPEAIAQAQVSGRFPFDKYAGYFLKSNLQGLCRLCHADKTNEDKLHTGPWPNVVDAEDRAPKKRWAF